MRTTVPILLLLAAAGCSRPPGVDTFVASPLPSAFIVLHSPNGQRQLLLERAGEKWTGQLDDTFASTSRVVVAQPDDGIFPEFVQPDVPGAQPVSVANWKKVRDRPALIVDAWAAADPSLRAPGPSAIVSMLRVAGDSPATDAINTALASELEGAAGLTPPPGDRPVDPGAIASRVAVEVAAHAVVDEQTGTVSPRARIAVLQIPVFLTSGFLSVEHFVYDERGDGQAGSMVSRFTLYDLKTGSSPDVDALLTGDMLERLPKLARDNPASVPETEAPVAWHPSRVGIVLVYRVGPDGESRRSTVTWEDALPLLAADSPLRAVADSVH